MEPKMIGREAFRVMGTMTRVKPEEETPETYGSIWREFEAHHETIKPHSTDGVYYGVSFGTAEKGVFDYLAGMAVGNEASALQGLVDREIPAARYAVFECPIQAIGETYRYIFGQWLPASSYEIDGSAAAFEQYPPEGDTEATVRIHIPVKEKIRSS